MHTLYGLFSSIMDDWQRSLWATSTVAAGIQWKIHLFWLSHFFPVQFSMKNIQPETGLQHRRNPRDIAKIVGSCWRADNRLFCFYVHSSLLRLPCPAFHSVTSDFLLFAGRKRHAESSNIDGPEFNPLGIINLSIKRGIMRSENMECRMGHGKGNNNIVHNADSSICWPRMPSHVPSNLGIRSCLAAVKTMRIQKMRCHPHNIGVINLMTFKPSNWLIETEILIYFYCTFCELMGGIRPFGFVFVYFYVCGIDPRAHNVGTLSTCY